MNANLKKLFEQAHEYPTAYDPPSAIPELEPKLAFVDFEGNAVYNYSKRFNPQKFAELILAAVYAEVKQDLTDQCYINEHQDPMGRAYLNGVNGGIADAMYRIQNMFENSEEDQ